MNSPKNLLISLTLLTAALALGGCGAMPMTETGKASLAASSDGALSVMKAEDSSLHDVLAKAHGYVIFPDVTKGAFGVSGAWGNGRVYERGQCVGYADITQAGVGLSVGQQQFSELIVFETEDAFNRFRENQLAFDAGASVIALKAGAAMSAKYTDGVAVFTRPLSGVMYDAHVGGQRFSFTPNNAGS